MDSTVISLSNALQLTRKMNCDISKNNIVILYYVDNKILFFQQRLKSKRLGSLAKSTVSNT